MPQTCHVPLFRNHRMKRYGPDDAGNPNVKHLRVLVAIQRFNPIHWGLVSAIIYSTASGAGWWVLPKRITAAQQRLLETRMDLSLHTCKTSSGAQIEYGN